jgi:hypothetical protein
LTSGYTVQAMQHLSTTKGMYLGTLYNTMPTREHFGLCSFQLSQYGTVSKFMGVSPTPTIPMTASGELPWVTMQRPVS